jgi:hypothetical protein
VGVYVLNTVPVGGPEDVSLLERCPHFRGCYVQASMASMELGPAEKSNRSLVSVHLEVVQRHKDVSLLERSPQSSEGVMYRLQWSWDLKMCPY